MSQKTLGIVRILDADKRPSSIIFGKCKHLNCHFSCLTEGQDVSVFEKVLISVYLL